MRCRTKPWICNKYLQLLFALNKNPWYIYLYILINVYFKEINRPTTSSKRDCNYVCGIVKYKAKKQISSVSTVLQLCEQRCLSRGVVYEKKSSLLSFYLPCTTRFVIYPIHNLLCKPCKKQKKYRGKMNIIFRVTWLFNITHVLRSWNRIHWCIYCFLKVFNTITTRWTQT